MHRATLAGYRAGEPCCLIEIRDTGTGISEENLPRIFVPFFSTKREKRGTGLGLHMAKMIVENHNGRIDVTSKKGTGTTVSIALPLFKGGGG